MSRSLDDLLPEVKEKAEKFLKACSDAGFHVLVTQTKRTPEEQDALYAQGRTKPGKIVTKAPEWQSWHVVQRAFDICFVDEHGHATWDGDWVAVGKIGEDCGLTWGGGPEFAHFKDMPHFEFKDGLTLAEARERIQRGSDGGKNLC